MMRWRTGARLGMMTSSILSLAGILAGEEDRIEFDRPEAWAMAYNATACIPAVSRSIPDAQPGAFALGVDALYLRRLNTRDEQVGFDGTAPEAMNRSPVLANLRAEAGLPAGIDILATWIPPLDVRGVRADVASLALERQFFEENHFHLGLRLFGAMGRITGDITSDEQTANSQPGSAGNPLDTEGESHDFFNLRMVGVDVLASEYLDGNSLRIYGGIEGSLMHLSFHVRSQEAGIVDRTVLTTQGETWALLLGCSGMIAENVVLGGSIYYSPLHIDRPPRALEPFVTARLSLTVILR
jgi:hypothetical protein